MNVCTLLRVELQTFWAQERAKNKRTFLDFLIDRREIPDEESIA